MFYEGHDYPSFDWDLQSTSVPNVVITSLDFEPAENAYAMSWVQTARRVDSISGAKLWRRRRFKILLRRMEA